MKNELQYCNTSSVNWMEKLLNKTRFLDQSVRLSTLFQSSAIFLAFSTIQAQISNICSIFVKRFQMVLYYPFFCKSQHDLKSPPSTSTNCERKCVPAPTLQIKCPLVCIYYSKSQLLKLLNNCFRNKKIIFFFLF